jgi:hypothetical protein
VLPSLYDPVAVNCWVPPTTRLGLAGLMPSDFRTGPAAPPQRTNATTAARVIPLATRTPAPRCEGAAILLRKNFLRGQSHYFAGEPDRS